MLDRLFINAMQCQCVGLVDSGASEVDACYTPPLLVNLQLCSVLWFLADRESKEMAVQSGGNYSAHSSIPTGVCVCVCVCVCSPRGV